jgi:hypothetical protein
MPVGKYCAVSALDRRLLGIRGPEGPETRPAVGEPEKNPRPCKSTASGARKYPVDLGKEGRLKKKVLVNPVSEEDD